MKIWGISDTHFQHGQVDSMSNYGEVWVHHTEKIIENWKEVVSGEDLVLIGGDIVWSTRLDQALTDIRMIDRLPGKMKIIIQGNHDCWWQEYESVCGAMPETIVALEGNAVKLEGQVICGTRGWISPNDPDFEVLDRNTFDREMVLLRNALDAAVKLDPVDGIHLLMHFPPFTTNGYRTPFFDRILEYPVITCTYGHFHVKKEWDALPKGMIEGITFHLTSTDYLENKPVLIWQG
ncbi:metallophosphoesterase [bacterium]|nr:metallophosphoesterase [bacterium]